jgi:hypothetical protein
MSSASHIDWMWAPSSGSDGPKIAWMPNSICLHAEIWKKYLLKNVIVAYDFLFSHLFIRWHPEPENSINHFVRDQVESGLPALGEIPGWTSVELRLCWLGCFVVLLSPFV